MGDTGPGQTSEAVANALKVTAVNYAGVRRAVVDFIFQTLSPAFSLDTNDPAAKVKFTNDQLSTASFANTLGLLKEGQIAEIETIINSNIDAEVKFADTAIAAIENIRRGPQLSLAFSSKIRPQGLVDDYRTEIVWDWGIYQRLNWTANVSYDYRNFAAIGGDIRGGRVAQYNSRSRNTGGAMSSTRIMLGLAVTLALASTVAAEDMIVIRAGELVRCTLEEPNLSSATVDVGDPVVCYLQSFREFGKSVFPRGSFLSGRVSDWREPGRIAGKGWLASHLIG